MGITNNRDSTGSPQYAATASYAPIGAVSSIIYGQATGFGGTTEKRNYNSRLETTSITASTTSSTAMNLAPCFTAFAMSSQTPCSTTATGNNSSVTGIVNSVDTNETQTFTYDNLNRILTGETKSTSGSDCWGLNFTGGIDAVGRVARASKVSSVP